MRLCDKCIALFRDAGYSVTEEPLSFGEYTYMKCDRCRNKYGSKVKVVRKEKSTVRTANPDYR